MSEVEREASGAEPTAALSDGEAGSRPSVELVACETCGSKEALAQHGSSDGARLIAQLRSLAGRAPEVRISSTRCLWACTRSCAVHVRSVGAARVGYVIASLDASETSAAALLEYAKLYAATTDGAVPFKCWPSALRGHFLCRIPSAPVPHAADPTPGSD